jgi:deoxyribodipyrimidine photo-lyase
LLYHYPHIAQRNLNAQFDQFPWQWGPSAVLERWQRGQTGFPIVDAGMRELWHTGFMHNRVRMIVASFLTKNLAIHWLEGARWFWDTLTDADLASNTQGWQWSAGSGADAQPYFRIFNPVSQGEKFDPDGVYVRRWIPELAKVSIKALHAPWTAPRSTHPDYPPPMVDLKASREHALAAYQTMRTRLPQLTGDAARDLPAGAED